MLVPRSAATQGKLRHGVAQDLHSYAFSSTGQAETLDPFQGPLPTHQLLSQQPNNSDANLTELPHRKGGRIALKAVHSPAASVPGLGAPSTIRSKSMKSTQRSEQSLQCKSLADFQEMLLPQVALTISLGMQASNPSTSFAEKHDIKTCDTVAHCLPPIQRSNTTRLNIVPCPLSLVPCPLSLHNTSEGHHVSSSEVCLLSAPTSTPTCMMQHLQFYRNRALRYCFLVKLSALQTT